jgi:hypothetical protein
MPVSRSVVSFLFLFVVVPSWGQTRSTPAPSDPQAVAIVQQAIAALGGSAAIGQAQTWKFQGRMDGQRKNEHAKGVLTTIIPEFAKAPDRKTPPPWATPRSVFIPALAGLILLKQSTDATYSVQQNDKDGIVFMRVYEGKSWPTQRWHFDPTTKLPTKIEFIGTPRIGIVHGFPGTVTLTDYRSVGGVLYPFQIVMSQRRQNIEQKIELMAVIPGVDAPSRNDYVGGVQ